MILHMFYDAVHSANQIDAINEAIKSSGSKEEHIFLMFYSKEMTYIDLSVYDYVIPMDVSIFQFSISEQGELAYSYMKAARKIIVSPLILPIAHLINRGSICAEIYWIAWGYDLYGNVPRDIYDELTQKFTGEATFAFDPATQAVIKKACLRIDCALLTNEEECAYAKTYLNKNFKTIEAFSSCTSKEFYSTIISGNALEPSRYRFKQRFDKVVLVGNSPACSNNHLSALLNLSRLKSDDFCVVAPLYEQGNLEYIDAVVEKGTQLFGNRFFPIREFLAFNEYVKILNEVDVALFNLYRQQAYNNIVMLFWLGKKVYLRKESLLYDHFLKKGVMVYELNNASYTEHMLDISPKQLKDNPKIIEKLIDRNTMINNFKSLFE